MRITRAAKANVVSRVWLRLILMLIVTCVPCSVP
jgi:hypothetical protein